MQLENIYRELSYVDLYRSQVEETGPDVGRYLIRFRSEIDLFAMSDQIEKALEQVREANPLLRCKIVADPNDKQKYYFAFDTPETLKKSLQLLYYKSSRNDEDQCIEYFHEEEINNFNPEPLWRFKIIKTGCKNGVYDYYIFYGSHHALSDGLNSIDMFHNVLKAMVNEKIEKKAQSNESKQTINEQKNEITHSLDPQVLFPFKPIPFLKSQSPIGDAIRDTDSDGAFYTIDDKKVFSLKEVAARSRNYTIKVKMFTLDGEYSKLVSREAAKRNIKVTSILDVIAAVAFKQVINTYTPDPNIKVPIVSVTPVNLRSRLDVGFSKMGLWMSLYRNEYDESVLDSATRDSSSFFSNTFWKLSKAHTEKLEDFAKPENAAKHNDDQETFCQHVYLHQDTLITDNVRGTFTLTYMNHSKLMSKGVQIFEFTEFYAGANYLRKNKKNMAAHCVSAINNRLCWTITYKTDNLSVEVVDLWAVKIKSVMDRLLSSCSSKL